MTLLIAAMLWLLVNVWTGHIEAGVWGWAFLWGVAWMFENQS